MWNKKALSQLDATLTWVYLTLTIDLDIWPWIYKVRLYLRNGRPDCHGTKGTRVARMPWCETQRKWVYWTLTFDLKFSRSNGISGMGGPIVFERKGRESIGCPDVKHERNESTGPWTLTLTFDLECARSNCISEMGDLVVIERRRWESIGCPDVKNKGNESTGCCADWGTFDLDLWPWIFKAKLYLGNGRPDCHHGHGSKGMGVHRCPIGMEWKGQESTGVLKMSVFPLTHSGFWGDQ